MKGNVPFFGSLAELLNPILKLIAAIKAMED